MAVAVSEHVAVVMAERLPVDVSNDGRAVAGPQRAAHDCGPVDVAHGLAIGSPKHVAIARANRVPVEKSERLSVGGAKHSSVCRSDRGAGLGSLADRDTNEEPYALPDVQGADAVAGV